MTGYSTNRSAYSPDRRRRQRSCHAVDVEMDDPVRGTSRSTSSDMMSNSGKETR